MLHTTIPHVVAVLVMVLSPILSKSGQDLASKRDSQSPGLTTISKGTELGPGYVFDDFGKLKIKKPGDDDDKPYWWVINNGDGMQFYEHQGDSSSAEAEEQNDVTFARLQLIHDTTPAIWDYTEYIAAEISEYRTMYSYGIPGRWLPTPSHPVTVSARVRFSENYNQDGRGGAVGTAGLWLWNSYVAPQSMNPVNVFGFNWVEQGSAGGLEGLQISALQDSIPIYIQPISVPVDMSAWHVWSFEWSVNDDGFQRIRWWLDNVPVGETTLTTPFEALTLTMWNDNQFVTFLEDGQYAVVKHNPQSPQNLDIDWVTIHQPQ